MKPQTLFILLSHCILLCFTAQAQFSQPGELDTTFNFGRPHSFFTDPANPVPGEGANFEINVSVRQTDGKVLIGGDFTFYNGKARNRIARLNPNGSLDDTFNPGIGANNWVNSLALQPDGKVLIGGFFNSYNGSPSNRIARLNANGSLDATFNTSIGVNNSVNSIAIQSDGKVLIVGNFTSYNGTSRIRTARINPDGSIDLSFNPDSGANDVVRCIALQSNGKILIGGDFTRYNGVTRNSLARLNLNGSLDTTFNIGNGANGIVESIVLQPDGKMLVLGFFSNYNGTPRNRIARLNADGSLDLTFDPGIGADGIIRTLALQPDNKIIIGGEFLSYNNIPKKCLTRLNSDGSLDSSFYSNTGIGGVSFPFIYSLTLQPDGKVFIGGNFTSYNDNSSNRFARLNSNGDIDETFNPSSGASGRIFALIRQPNGMVLIGGEFSFANGKFRNRIARLNMDGSLDSTFDSGIGVNNTIFSMALQPDGKVLIGGNFTSFNGISRNRIARLNADGTIDSTFNPGTGANSIVWSFALRPDGKVLVGGWFTSYNGTIRNHVACLNSDGSLDVTFNPGTGVNGPNSPVIYSLLLQSDGKVLIGGDFTSYNGTARNSVCRLNVNGTLDATFNPGTGIDGPISPVVRNLSLQPNGKILIGGQFSSYNGIPRNRIVRLNADGSLDSTFNPGTGANGTVWTLTIQQDNKVLIGGEFTSYNGTSSNRIARLNSDGSLDITFGPSLGASSIVNSLALQPDNKLVISGDFLNFDGTSRSRIARIFSPECLTLPLAPTVQALAAICAGTSNTITPISGGVNYRFYATSTGGNPLPGGNLVSSFITPILPNTTTFHIASVSAQGCESNTRTSVTVTVNPLPSAPTTPTPSAICTGNTATITPTAGGANYRFYVASTGGSPLAGGNGVASFTTPTLSSTTTYHVASVSAQGCESSTRTTITVTVNPLPPAPIVPAPAPICAGNTATITPTAGGANYRFYVASTGGSPLAGGNGVASFTTPILSSTTIYHVASVNSAGCESSTRTSVTVMVNQLPLAPTVSTPAAICSGNTATITPSAGGVNYRFYAASSGGSPLAGGNGVASFTTSTLSSNTFYHVASVNSAGCESNTRTVVTVTVNPLPSAPTVSAQAAICAGNTAAITPSAGGANYRFYAASTGGSPLAGGNGVASFTTPTLSSTTTYHVASVSAAGCESSTRTAVTVTVNPLPSAPTAPAPAAICSGTTATITPTGGGANYRFYAASTGGSPLTGGNGIASYTTPTLTTNTTYHVASVSVAGCESSTRTAVTVTVNPLPSAPTAPAPAAICSGTTATITPTAGGANYRFYAASTGGSPLAGGNGVASYITPSLTTTTTYHVASVSVAGCESSTRTSVTVLVNSLPIVNILQVGDTLKANSLPGSYQWLLNGAIVTGATSLNFLPTQSGLYTLRVTSPQGCIGISNAINFIVTGLETSSANSLTDWSVFPIPFQNELRITAQSPFNYQIMDLRGVVHLSGLSEASEASCFTNDLASGMYLVKITLKGQTYVRKVVKE